MGVFGLTYFPDLLVYFNLENLIPNIKYMNQTWNSNKSLQNYIDVLKIKEGKKNLLPQFHAYEFILF